jgi:hypothetical protein
MLDNAAVGVEARATDVSTVGLTRVDDFGPYLVDIPLPR